MALLLSENIFFDTALVYSSHEFISQRWKKLHDDSPNDSLIFVNDGPTDLISEKSRHILELIAPPQSPTTPT